QIDDLTMLDYRETVKPNSPQITLLSPTGMEQPYFSQFGWVGANQNIRLPDAGTVWTANQTMLGINTPVTLRWDNGAGLRFKRTVSIDENYMFSITQTVTNSGASPVTLYPYGLISRTGVPDTLGFYILHEGLLGVFNGQLKEVDYDDLDETGQIAQKTTGGWIGITDKYWLVALVPDQKAAMQTHFRHTLDNNKINKYQADYLGGAYVIAPGGAATVDNRLFAGAKEVPLLDAYEENLGIARFDLAVDFGWFYFLTKPIFYALVYFYGVLGNYGLAILLLTVLIKLIFFPLANKSYVSMSAMKKLQPKMVTLRERYKDDKAKQNEAMMKLYRDEKVNPASGCLPIVVQIPVFFALYKVLFVSIEMRHTPFYGWIQDLSARDPTTLFNLFGLIPWSPPDFLMIGVWPVIMGVTMFLQQKLNPAPADPMQAKIFMFLPFVFTIMLATFPAGLVIYWTWNNLLSITQQWVIMRRMGVKIS
ncbi:MAG: membrane protein insertase YidC, partial [Alphaproteobacteria bacterium]